MERILIIKTISTHSHASTIFDNPAPLAGYLIHNEQEATSYHPYLMVTRITMPSFIHKESRYDVFIQERKWWVTD
jgi:hypothetical protein